MAADSVVDERIAILLVDDEPRNLLALQAVLEREEYRLILAGSGREALRCLLDNECAAIVLDVHMDDMDGFETAALIRARERSRLTPIIFLTASNRDAFAAMKGYDLGAVDYLYKPPVPDVLRAKLAVFAELYRNRQESRRLAERLALVVQERNEQIAAVERLSRAKDELMAVVSHELRSPLSSLLGYAELMLAREYKPEAQREILTIMVEEGQRLASLINDFLDLRRLEDGNTPIAPVVVHLPLVIARAVAAAGHHPATPIVLNLAGDVPPVMADPNRLQQVLINLLSNARKYSPRGGEIHISAKAVGARVEIGIRDQGLGIPKRALTQLFQSFFRVKDPDREDIPGSGLGLAIVRQIVEAHGGMVRATSAGPGRGSTFTISFPAAISDEVPPPPTGGSQGRAAHRGNMSGRSASSGGEAAAPDPS